jgi:hypothetical protein
MALRRWSTGPAGVSSLEPQAGDIEAYDFFEQGLGRDFYGQLLGTLEQIGGYVRG